MTAYLEVSKVDVATAQLDRAIQLYLENDDLISSITLSGAAEEILGKLVSQGGQRNAFDETIDRLCEMHVVAYQEEPDRTKYTFLSNEVRNEFKHLCTGTTLEVNLDAESGALIGRAIENYKKLFPGSYPRFREFEQEWINRQNAIVAATE